MSKLYEQLLATYNTGAPFSFEEVPYTDEEVLQLHTEIHSNDAEAASALWMYSIKQSFLLNAEQSTLVETASKIISSHSVAWVYSGDITNGMPSTTEEQALEIIADLKRKRISLTKLVKLANEALSQKWYTFYAVPLINEASKAPSYKYYLFSHGVCETLTELPEAKYKKALSVTGQLCPFHSPHTLGLSLNYRFLSPAEYNGFKMILLVDKFQSGTQAPDTESYALIFNDNVTNALTKITTKKFKNYGLDQLTFDDITGTATVVKDDLKLTFSTGELAENSLDVNTLILLDILIGKFTESSTKNPAIHISVSEFMKERNITDATTAREAVKKSTEILSSLKFTYSGNIDSQFKDVDINLMDCKGTYHNGDVLFVFGNTFSTLLKKSPLMPYPKALRRVSSRNSSYFLGRKIAEYRNINTCNPKQRDFISVASLLEVCRTIPRYEDLGKAKQVNQRIIAPFEESLNDLEELFTWEYCHSKDEPLTDAEIENLTYDVFINLLVHIHWNKDYPNQAAFIERKEQQKLESSSKSAKAKK